MKLTRRQLIKLITESLSSFSSPHKRYVEISGENIPPEWKAEHPSNKDVRYEIRIEKVNSSALAGILTSLAGAISHMNQRGMVALIEYHAGKLRLVDNCKANDINNMTEDLNSFVELYSSMSDAPIFDLSTDPLNNRLIATISADEADLSDAAEFSMDIGWDPQWGASTPSISGWYRDIKQDTKEVTFYHSFSSISGGNIQVSFDNKPTAALDEDVKICNPTALPGASVDNQQIKPSGRVFIRAERVLIHHALGQDSNYRDEDGVALLRASPAISKIEVEMRIIKGTS